MRYQKIIVVLVLINCIIYTQSVINGTVQSTTNNLPMQNCNVSINNSNIGTITDMNGKFSLSTDLAGEHILIISHIGFDKFEREVELIDGSAQNINVIMQPIVLDGELVTVSAAKSVRRIYETPGRIDVLTKDYLANMPSQSLDDLLNYAAGINVHRTSGIFEIRPVVTLRGLSGDEPGRTLILLDGIPINKADTGVANWNQMNIDAVERIEIYKGSGSALHGNGAMGGTINIISSVPTNDFSGRIKATAGTYNTYGFDFNINGGITDNLLLNIGAVYKNSDGYIDQPDSLQDENTALLYLEEEGFNIGAKYYFNSDAIINLSYDYFDGIRGEGVKIQKEYGNSRQFTTNTIRGVFRKKFGLLELNLSGYWQFEDYIRIDERYSRGVYSHFDVESDRIDKGLIFNSSFISTLGSFTLGGELKQGSVDGGDYYTTSPDTIINQGRLLSGAAYLQYELGLLDNQMKIASSLRLDGVKFYDGYFGANIEGNAFHDYSGNIKDNYWQSASPRIGIRYFFDNGVSLYSAYSRGFRSANLDDLCRTGWMRLGPKLANPKLGPETLDNIEIGLDWSPLKSIKISPTAYYSKGSDFIYYVDTGELLWGRRPIYKSENVTAVIIKGFELDLLFRPFDGVSWMLNYTYNDSKISTFTEAPELEGNYLIYSPLNQINSVLSFSHNFLSANVGISYKDKQFISDDNSEELDGYIIYNCQLSAKMFNNFKISLDAHNISDERITEHPERLSPGRMFILDTSYAW